MILDLRTITHETRGFDFSLGPDWWNITDQKDHPGDLCTPLSVHIEIYKTGERYILSGEISGGFHMTCDRCLESYHKDIASEFQIILTPPSWESNKPETELSDKDMQVGFISEEEMDLGEIIREQIYLSFPIKSLCKEDCLGLCPVCGANLNTRPCSCLKDKGHPGFLELKRVKLEGEK
ncbi:MAG: DUF177 domain-containing protein [Deltaproteobacteria bacterium]|nr:DUF177 domain-containing protein [Deltaproteobacteria bacterium]